MASMSLWRALKIDLSVNYRKGKYIVGCYRIANYFALHKSAWVRVLGYPFIKYYQYFIVWHLGIEIPVNTRIGIGLSIGHGVTVVVNEQAVIGDYVFLRQYTTIGNKQSGLGSPIIGNHVEIGANSVIIGEISIGDNVVIGAGSIVTKSIPSNCIAYGNPLKIIAKPVGY